MDSPLSHLDDAVNAYRAHRDAIREQAGALLPVGFPEPERPSEGPWGDADEATWEAEDDDGF